MKKIRMSLVCLIAVAICFAGCAKTVVTRVQPLGSSKQPEMSGVFYALPRTVIKIDVPVKKKAFAPGKFVRYAKCFFPDVDDDDIIKEKKKSFSVGAPTFSSRAEPDPQQVFLIKVPGGFFEDKALLLDLTADGVMTKGEASSTSHALEIATGALKTFVPILSSLATGGVAAAAASRDADDKLTAQQIDCLNGYRRKKTAAELDVERARNPGKIPAPYDEPNDLRDAKKAYEQIIDMQAARDRFVSGGATLIGLPSETLTLMLKELDERIESLKNLFLGSVSEKTWTAKFEYTQVGNAMGRELFEYSESGGVCTVNYSGVNLLDPDFKSATDCGLSPNKVMLSLRMGKQGIPGPQFWEGVRDARFKETGERGFYYRIPAHITASVEIQTPVVKSDTGTRNAEYKTTEKGHDNIAIAQLGIIASLPASTNGRTTKYTLALYEETGAMKNFTLGSDALIQKSEIEDVGVAADSIVDARNAKKAAKAAENDELKQLERKRQILEEMVKIRAAEQELNKPKP